MFDPITHLSMCDFESRPVEGFQVLLRCVPVGAIGHQDVVVRLVGHALEGVDTHLLLPGLYLKD